MQKYDEMKSLAISEKSRIKQSFESSKELKAQYDELTTSLADEKESLNIQGYAIDTLKEIMDKLSEEHVEKIVSLLTYALSVIFYDKNYSVDIDISDKRNVKTAELVLVEVVDDKVIRSSFRDEIGGGILAVCGFVLQVYYLNVLNLAPVIFIDEGLSQLSSEYIPSLMQFIKELADKKGLIVVLISHDERMISYADKSYLVEDGNVKEVKSSGRSS